MNIKPKEVMLNLPIVLTFQNSDEPAAFAANINSLIHGKVRVKYDELGMLGEQLVAIFYLNRNDEYHSLHNQFVDLIEKSEINDYEATTSVSAEFDDTEEDSWIGAKSNHLLDPIDAYTIGLTESYNESLMGEDPPKKLGRGINYAGGWVWKTAKEAKRFLWSDAFATINWGDGKPRDPKDFSVYGLILPNGWDEDVKACSPDCIENCGVNVNHLLNDAWIVGLEK